MGIYLSETKDSKAGFTQVWEGKPTAFISVIKQWAAISEKLMQVDSAADTGLITLWIANEHIDWRRYRSSGEYKPVCNDNNLRHIQPIKPYDLRKMYQKIQDEHLKG